jgi:hypothetical protein
MKTRKLKYKEKETGKQKNKNYHIGVKNIKKGWCVFSVGNSGPDLIREDENVP